MSKKLSLAEELSSTSSKVIGKGEKILLSNSPSSTQSPSQKKAGPVVRPGLNIGIYMAGGEIQHLDEIEDSVKQKVDPSQKKRVTRSLIVRAFVADHKADENSFKIVQKFLDTHPETRGKK